MTNTQKKRYIIDDVRGSQTFIKATGMNRGNRFATAKRDKGYSDGSVSVLQDFFKFSHSYLGSTHPFRKLHCLPLLIAKVAKGKR